MLAGVVTTAIPIAYFTDMLVSRRLLDHRRAAGGVGVGGGHVVDRRARRGRGVGRRGPAQPRPGRRVVVESDPANRHLPRARALRMPVVFGDATTADALRDARVERAAAVAVTDQRRHGQHRDRPGRARPAGRAAQGRPGGAAAVRPASWPRPSRPLRVRVGALDRRARRALVRRCGARARRARHVPRRTGTRSCSAGCGSTPGSALDGLAMRDLSAAHPGRGAAPARRARRVPPGRASGPRSTRRGATPVSRPATRRSSWVPTRNSWRCSPGPGRNRRRAPGTRRGPARDDGAVTATILDGKATLATIIAELAERVAKLAAAGRTPGLGTVLVGDDPGSQSYVAGQAPRLRQGRASPRSAATCPPTPPRPTSRRPSTSSTPTRRAPATSCSSRCPKGLDANAVLERVDPGKDADGLHPTNLGRLVLDEPAPLPCTPRGIVELLRRYDVALDGAKVTVLGPRHHRRPPAGPAAHPAQRERHRDPVPHRHPRPGRRGPRRRRRRGGRRRARAWSPRTWSSPAPPCSTSASPAARTASSATSPTDVREVAGYVAPNPGGVGPMTRAMLLTNVVERAEALLGSGA